MFETEEADEELDLLPPADDEEDEKLGSAFAQDLDEDFVDAEEPEVFDESAEVFEDDLDLDNFDDLDIDDEDDDDEVNDDEEDDEDY